MAQSSRAMRSVHESLLSGEEEAFTRGKPVDRVQLLNLLAKAMHDTKLCTAHLCWHDFVRPLRVHKAELEQGLQRLKAQLRLAREAYLKEVSTLRDRVRSRWDPTEGYADVILFYEPLQTLEPQEKSFMVDMVREVIKNMVDVNPQFAGSVNSGQIERLISEAHEKEMEDLREKLQEKTLRIKELQEAKLYLENQMAKGGKMTAPDNSVLAKYEQMMRLMEDQLGCLRVDFWNMQQEHQKLQQEKQQAEVERQELGQKLEKESSENRVLQEEVARLCSAEEGFKDTIHLLESEKSNLKHSVHELQTRATNLNRALQRRTRKAAEEQAPECAGKEEEHDLAHSMEAYKAAEHELTRERDAALRARDQLQERCEELEKLLRAHCSQLSTLSAQQMEEAAQDLSQQAQSLGCSPRSVEKVRVCQCGNVLMQDAQFCRKCGVRWEGGTPPASPSSQAAAVQISNLNSQIRDVEQALCEATREMGEGREAFRTESVAGISQSISHILRPVTVEDLPVEPEVQKQQMETARLRKELDGLKQSKLLAEARLLSQRCEELSKQGSFPVDLDEAMLAEDPIMQIHACDGVNCKYRKELEAAQAMIQALRGLGSQMADKLQVATGEHLQMSMALTTMQGSLEAAVQAVERDVHDVEQGEQVDLQRTLGKVSKSLQESKRRSVFWRLYQNRSSSKRSHRQTEARGRRVDLLQRTYEQLYKVEGPRSPVELIMAKPLSAGPLRVDSVTPPPPMPALPERPAVRSDARRSTLPAVTPRVEKPTEKVASSERPKGAALIVLGADFPKPPATPEPPRTWSQRRRR
ncbi:unnamed protein product [Symbiodinium natans]|uniref:Uncharacterized protein n=1 Tax=Symbiodinium natans TaxID=878477 RepID=A0A812UA76_9DINO|nr:unnamed protein product [Symbiodinium natans]